LSTWLPDELDGVPDDVHRMLLLQET